MYLDLYNPGDLTKDGIRRLLASKTGKESGRGLYRLQVTKTGRAYIKDDARPPTQGDWQNHAILFEIWNRSYVGQKAAQDDEWVSEVYKMLKCWWRECLNWPHGGVSRMPDAFYADSLPPCRSYLL